MNHAVPSALRKLALAGGLVLSLASCMSAHAVPEGAAGTATTANTAANSCTRPDPAALRSAWQGFRSAMLQGQAEQTGKFLRFPLKLLSPMRGDKPLVVTRPVFLSNYAQLFQVGAGDYEVALLTEMKKSSGNEYVPTPAFDESRCAWAGPVRIGDYNFSYDKKTGWLIESIYYGQDYALAKDFGFDRATAK